MMPVSCWQRLFALVSKKLLWQLSRDEWLGWSMQLAVLSLLAA